MKNRTRGNEIDRWSKLRERKNRQNLDRLFEFSLPQKTNTLIVPFESKIQLAYFIPRFISMNLDA